MIISNPPYISNKDYKALEPNVKWYEPKLALCAGRWNLNFYKVILDHARDLLKEGGILAFEVDNKLRHMNDLEEFFEYFGFTDPEIYKDYNRRDRVMIATLKKRNK
ncbi:MAG: hypothetical protein MJ246_01910 [Clostridia bacterium]|nr:hypothetical protein [Clostridia bacterium]